MSKNNALTLVLAIIMLIVGLSPLAAQEEGDNIGSVCLITNIGRVSDGTSNQYAYEGMIAAAQEFELETDYIETTSDTDYESNIQICIDAGFEVVITVGEIMDDVTSAAAEDNADIFFIGVDQTIIDGPQNMIGIQYREDQAGFLAGVLAAMVTETDIVAGIYGSETPSIVKIRHGFEMGVAYIDDEVTTLGVYIDDFNDPDTGAFAAEQFIGDGADVIFGAGGPTSSGAILAAAAEGVWVIGVDQDEYFTSFGEGETDGAEYLISSAMKRVDQGVYDMLEALYTGDEEAWPAGGDYILDVANGGITFAGPHDADIDEEYYEELKVILVGLIEGEIETGVDPATGEMLEEESD